MVGWRGSCALLRLHLLLQEVFEDLLEVLHQLLMSLWVHGGVVRQLVYLVNLGKLAFIADGDSATLDRVVASASMEQGVKFVCGLLLLLDLG